MKRKVNNNENTEGVKNDATKAQSNTKSKTSSSAKSVKKDKQTTQTEEVKTASPVSDTETGAEVEQKPKKSIWKIILTILVIALVITGVVFLLIIRQKNIKQKTEGVIVNYMETLKSNGSSAKSLSPFIDSGYSMINEEANYYEVEEQNPAVTELVAAICSTIEYNFDKDDKGNNIVGETTTMYVKTVDTAKLLEVLKSEEGYTGAIEGLEGNPRDVDIYYNEGLRYLAKKVSEAEKTSKARKINVKVIRDKERKAYFVSESLDVAMEEILFCDENWVKILKEVSRIIQGKGVKDYSAEELYNNYTIGTAKRIEAGITRVIGNGSLEKPAGLNTKVETVYNDGSDEGIPIYLELKEIYVGDDAVTYANSKDVRNRGLLGDASNTIYIIRYSITNISDNEIVVANDFSVADKLANIFSSTGTLFGMDESATIPAHETAVLDYYILNSDTENRYLMWGGSFNRKYENVWFNIFN